MRRTAQPLPIQRMRSGQRRRFARTRGVVGLLIAIMVLGAIGLWFGFTVRSADTQVTAAPSTRVAPINHAGLIAPRDRQRSEAAEGQSAVAIEWSPSLRLRMTRDSWVEVFDAQGTRLEHNLLRAGEAHDFEGQAPFSVLLSQGLAAEIWFHGQRVEFEEPLPNGLLRLQIGDEQRLSSTP